MYSNCCCSSSFEPEIINIGQSSHKMYSNNIVNFQEATTILNACTKKVCKLIEGNTYIYIHIGCPKKIDIILQATNFVKINSNFHGMYRNRSRFYI